MSTKAKKKTRWGCLAVLILLALPIGMVFITDPGDPDYAKINLPETATEIQEHYWSTSIPPEFHSILKARISRDEVEAYANKVGAIKKVSGKRGEYSMSWMGSLEWFSPKKEPLFYYHEQQYRIIVGWEDGYVYYDEMKW